MNDSSNNGISTFESSLKLRNDISVPLASEGQINQETIYEDPIDSTKKLSLPIYYLADRVVHGERLPSVFMQSNDDNWVLIVYLSQSLRVPDAVFMEHSIKIILRFVLPFLPSLAKELEFRIQKDNEGILKGIYEFLTFKERDQIFQVLTDANYQAQLLIRSTVDVAVPAEQTTTGGDQLYKPIHKTVDINIDRMPFVFDAKGSVSQFEESLLSTTESLETTGVILRQVEYQGKQHLYFQDETTPTLFYYLPDSFKITRRSQIYLNKDNQEETVFFREPNIRIRFSSQDGSLEKMWVNLEYSAGPVFDWSRLNMARVALEQYVPPLPISSGDTNNVRMTPFLISSSDQINLSINIPRSNASKILREDRPGVIRNLHDSITDAITGLSVQEFQDIFDALFSKSAVIFMGDVTIAGMGQFPNVSIPFIARLSDLDPPLLEISADGGKNSIMGTWFGIRNVYDRPVTLRTLSVGALDIIKQGVPPNRISQWIHASAIAIAKSEFDQNANHYADKLNIIDPPIPAQGMKFNVNEYYLFDIKPDGYDYCLFAFEAEVDSNPNDIWNAMLDPSVPAEYFRTIQIEAFAEWFAPHTDVLALGLDFENGTSITLNSNNLKAEAKVRTPLTDIILRRVQKPDYRYTLIVVRQKGQSKTQKTGNLDILFPDPTN